MGKDKNSNNIFVEEIERIKWLESVLKTKWREYIVSDGENGIKVKGPPAELRELFAMEIDLMALKRRQGNFPKEMRLK